MAATVCLHCQEARPASRTGSAHSFPVSMHCGIQSFHHPCKIGGTTKDKMFTVHMLGANPTSPDQRARTCRSKTNLTKSRLWRGKEHVHLWAPPCSHCHLGVWAQ